MPTTTKARKLAKLIMAENKNGMSYRVMARLCQMKNKNGKLILKAGTLNRFAKSKGEWIPKNREILQALGLGDRPRQKRIQDMTPTELLWCIDNREEFTS